jgi:hypothetical protein
VTAQHRHVNRRPAPKKDTEEAADANCTSISTLRHAKDELNIEAKKDGREVAMDVAPALTTTGEQPLRGGLAIDDHRHPELVVQANAEDRRAEAIRGRRGECWEGGIELS